MTPLDKIRFGLDPTPPKNKEVPAVHRNKACPCGSGRKAKNCLCKEQPVWP